VFDEIQAGTLMQKQTDQVLELIGPQVINADIARVSDGQALAYGPIPDFDTFSIKKAA
jgi:hypothetical protein